MVAPQRLMKFPFRVDGNGHISSETDPTSIAKQKLVQMIGTNPGERVMLPNYGVSTQRYLFEPMVGPEPMALQMEIVDTARAYAPQVNITAVAPVTQPGGDSVLALNVEFEPASGSAELFGGDGSPSKVTIEIGGSVSNG